MEKMGVEKYILNYEAIKNAKTMNNGMEEQEQNGVTPPKAIAINCAKNFDFPCR
jgi:hypothetical protein